MKEIVVSISPGNWELIKSGGLTVLVTKSAPGEIFFPLRVLLHIPEIGFVGELYCNEIRETIRPEQFAGAGKSCIPERTLHRTAAGSALFGLKIKPESILKYPHPLTFKQLTRTKTDICQYFDSVKVEQDE